MATLRQKIEGILFVTAKPLSVKKLAELCDAKRDDVAKEVDALAEEYDARKGGVRIMRNGNDVRMATSADVAKIVQQYLKDETTGELTKPSLEALTIIAYRSPITKGELEQVRGVNCSLILRNLMMRGLVEADGEHGMPTTLYSVTTDFLRFLGIANLEELPDYDKLRSHENIARVLEEGSEGPAATENTATEETASDETEPSEEGMEAVYEDAEPVAEEVETASEEEKEKSDA